MEFLLHYMADAGDLSYLGTLEKWLLECPCARHRTLSAKAIVEVEKQNKDKSAFSVLIKVLKDSVTEVKLAVSEALIEMEEY